MGWDPGSAPQGPHRRSASPDHAGRAVGLLLLGPLGCSPALHEGAAEGAPGQIPRIAARDDGAVWDTQAEHQVARLQRAAPPQPVLGARGHAKSRSLPTWARTHLCGGPGFASSRPASTLQQRTRSGCHPQPRSPSWLLSPARQRELARAQTPHSSELRTGSTGLWLWCLPSEPQEGSF